MNLPDLSGFVAMPHDPAPPSILATGVTVGTGVASLAQVVSQSPLAETVLVGLVNTVGAVLLGAAIKHLTSHARHRREARELHLKHQHEADTARIRELTAEVERLKAGRP